MPKNSGERRKRKYGDKRKAATASNRAKRPTQHAARQERMIARTESLLGTQARVRIPGYAKAIVGNVIAILRKGDPSYPIGAKRSVGSYVVVRTNAGDRTVSRHRIKPVKKA